MPFLEALITRTGNGFKTSVYHRPTFSEVYSNFNSFISEEYKVGLIFTLLFRTFSIVSDFSGFNSEVYHLKEILKKNEFPIKLIDSCIKNFLNKRLIEKPVTTNYGETYRHLRVRVGEHSGVSPLTGKKSKCKKSTAVKDHMLFCDHIVSIDVFKILATSNSDFKVKESLLISRDEPILNKNETSLPLYLFD